MESIWCASVLERGFAILPDVLAHGEVTALTEHLSHVAIRRSRAGIRHALGNAAFKALAWDPRLLEIAQNILGGDAFPFHATLFDKSQDANWLVVWHQDTALPLREREERPGWGPWSVKEGVVYAHAPASALSQVVALRVHFDDSTERNGPLRVIPGSHSRGVLEDSEIHELAERVEAVECIIAKGGVLAMKPLLVHASSKSLTETPRRVLHIEYGTSTTVPEGMELASS